jgi:hypothetical protein
MRKWMWLFVNGCECKSPIFTETEFLNSFQGGVNDPKYSDIMKNNDNSME